MSVSTVRKRIEREPSEIIESIVQTAESVKDASAELSTCIEEFETYLSSLRGRIEATCFIDHPDYLEQDRTYLAIKLLKEGKAWKLHWATWFEQHEHDENFSVDWKPLAEAPLRVKVEAVSNFEKVLETVERAQKKIVARAEAAKKTFQAFKTKLKASEGK